LKKAEKSPEKNSIFDAIYFILIDTSKIIFNCRFSSFHIQISFTNQFEPVGKLKKREGKISTFAFSVPIRIGEVSVIKRFSAPNHSHEKNEGNFFSIHRPVEWRKITERRNKNCI
jgi:hypothetical protein